jgi:CheY-like chemotaxis protein
MEKILIIDDSQINRAVARLALEEKKYVVIEAGDGQAALDILPKEQPDLILLDVIMPGLNGFETCKIIRSNPQTQHIPIIFVTALNEIPSKREGFKIGADDYITKPYFVEDLLLRVELILSAKRAKDGLAVKAQEMEAFSNELSKKQRDLIEKEKELLLNQVYVALHHEIRNPLTTILIGSQVLDSMFITEGPAKKVITEIVTCAKRIRGIMDSLGNMKEVILAEYADGTMMVDFNKSNNLEE